MVELEVMDMATEGDCDASKAGGETVEDSDADTVPVELTLTVLDEVLEPVPLPVIVAVPDAVLVAVPVALTLTLTLTLPLALGDTLGLAKHTTELPHDTSTDPLTDTIAPPPTADTPHA